MRDGFDFQGTEIDVRGGSFGRYQGDLDAVDIEADARPTAPGYFEIGMDLPGTGDMFTEPVSMPPVPGTCSLVGCTGGAAGGAGGGATTTFFFGTTFFSAAFGAG
jgi:hypothetical protein